MEVLLAGQSPSGALVASPSFPVYGYCWFRDASFCAHALDRVGQGQAAARFHDWAVRTLRRERDRAREAMRAARRGERPQAYIRARYTLEGEAEEEDWANFQLDGLGTWLWSLREHLRRSGGELGAEEEEAVELVVDYLAALWRLPCFDLWEEHGDHRHTSTLAALAGGLEAVGGWHPRAGALAEEIRREIHTLGSDGGTFVKFLGQAGLDASLLSLGTPYGVVGADHPLLVATLRRIEARLRGACGGLRRYPDDSYYGGGEWVLLTAWLGWHQAESGAAAAARPALRWVEAQADPQSGELPEQLGGEERDPRGYADWLARWGPPARPLLWSHAMHLILADALGGAA